MSYPPSPDLLRIAAKAAADELEDEARRYYERGDAYELSAQGSKFGAFKRRRAVVMRRRAKELRRIANELGTNIGAIQ